MQRQKMSLLKAQLRYPKYTENHNIRENTEKSYDQNTNLESVKSETVKSKDIRVKYEPGVILKISFSNPIESDKLFKVPNQFNLLLSNT